MDLSGDSPKTGFFDKLRIIPYQKFSGAFNMALDYVLAQRVQESDTAILRFYGWTPYSISLGYHQNAELVDFNKITSERIECVRRPTGGSAILHAEELTYSLIIPRKIMDHLTLYQLFHEILANVLKSLGFPVELHRLAQNDNYLKNGSQAFACFNRPAYTELKCQGKKVVGSAQKLYQNSILQHGSILLGRFQDKIIDFLKVDKNRKEKYRSDLIAKSISLSEIRQTTLNEIQLADKIAAAFQTLTKRMIYRYPDLQEMEAARQQEEKFRIHAN